MAASHTGPDVLFLNSYHPGLGWSDAVLQGVRETMRPHEQLAIEYLDSKHFESPRLDSVVAQLFEHKYRRNPPHVIVSSDDYALQFLFAWRDSLFPGVPVVFCGINAYRPEMIRGRTGYTGLNQWNHMFETVQIITGLLPDTRDVWVVTENTATGTGNRRRLDSLAKASDGALDFHFVDSAGTPSWDEIRRLVKGLGKGSVVYWSELYRDRDGLGIDPEVDLAALVRESSVPFFTHQASYLSAGIVGGDCNHGFLHGKQAGHIARRVLSGESPDSIPVQQDSSVFPTFRHDALERFGISQERLPEGSEIIGLKPPVWKAYPIQTAVAAGAIALLMGMAAALSLVLRRARRNGRALAKSESSLREAETALRRLFDALADGVTVFRGDGRIEFMNAAGLRMYGVSADDIVRLGVKDLCAAESFDEAQSERLWKSVIEGASAVHEFRARKPYTDEEFDAECALAPMSVEGAPRVVAVVRDATERIDARRVLERSREELEHLVQERTRELSRANKELEAFAYSVSHDLRAPLRSVNGFAQALDEDLAGMLQPEQANLLARIRAASLRMSDIIDSMLNLSRISTAPLEHASIPMAQIVESIRKPLAESHPEVAWVMGEIPDAIGDPGLIAPLWSNLLDNAVKYSSRASNPRIEIGSFVSEYDTTWFVRDNGVGFDLSHSVHLFEPFRRMHTIEEFPGLGIGLATVRRIVQRHGGRIWAESAVGEGATFFFTLG